MIDNAPRKRPPIYSLIVAGGSRLPGCGPCRLDFELRPLPLATSSCLPSGVTRTDVGYQPTGIKPSGRLFPGFETSKTARLLLHALAIKAARHRAIKPGCSVEPGGDAGKGADKVSIIFPTRHRKPRRCSDSRWPQTIFFPMDSTPFRSDVPGRPKGQASGACSNQRLRRSLAPTSGRTNAAAARPRCT